MRGTPFEYQGFTGGLNTIDSQFTVEDAESRDCLNVVGTERGAIVKRNGSTLFTGSPPSAELTSLAAVDVSGTRYLIAFGGTKVYSIDTSGTVTDITGSASITSGSRWEVVQAPTSTGVSGQGPVYMSNGVDAPLQWSGSGNVAAWTGVSDGSHYGTSPYVPNGQFMVFHANRIWMTGISGDTSAVWFSDVISAGSDGGKGDPSAWPLTNFVRFDSSDGNPITGIGVCGPYLVVFKETKAWVITDPDTGANRPLSFGIGCVAHRSIVPTVDGTFFLTADQGVFLVDPGGTKLVELSYKVRPTILGINQSLRSQAAGCFTGNHYYLSFPSGTSTTNNRTLDYDLQLKAWWLHDLAGNQWTAFEPTSGLQLYAAKAGAGNGVVRAFVPDIYTDSGSAYTGANGLSAYWFGAWQRFFEYFMRHRIQIPMVKKRVRQVYFNGSGVIVPLLAKNFGAAMSQYGAVVNAGDMATPQLPVDFSSGGQVFGNSDTTQLFGGTLYSGATMIYGGQTSTQDARIYAPGVAEEWSVGFGNTTSDPFTVNAYAYAVQIRKS